MSPLKWTLKSTTQLARALTDKGFAASPTLVRGLLHGMGDSYLQLPRPHATGCRLSDTLSRFRGSRCAKP